MIHDGRSRFTCSLAEFYQQPVIVSHVARLGVLIPPVSDVDTGAAPALARIDTLEGVSRWISDCPDCRVGASYVWLDQPLMFCANCANRAIDHRWRPVVVPPNRRQIERLIAARPDPLTRAWVPGETLDRIRADNARLGVK